MKFLLIIPPLLLLMACSNKKVEQVDPPERWYSSEHVKLGQNVFMQNCAVCHGKQAQGQVDDWKQILADGGNPAPPLNGTAHAWHHSLSNLLRTIQNGGVPLGGTMPGFKGKLSQSEQLAAIAYFQSLWSDKIYNAWLERDGFK
ncbi:cytochrome C oxidase Cbb3 [Hydrogenovibrio sp. SC-1]|uniref:c-type cytochrome n=1 Tax=Hydrogenovibrio sp. SC-1 TaxID=2065820 RepID=UPI000C7E77C0|nr:c-type cytochrome [Hydrogenovibrio sp. SC-1]PLA74945.1 cytochrome C oxidase Cbb3 [Hydrogenovibrio sp. SC-1]